MKFLLLSLLTVVRLTKIFHTFQLNFTQNFICGHFLTPLGLIRYQKKLGDSRVNVHTVSRVGACAAGGKVAEQYLTKIGLQKQMDNGYIKQLIMYCIHMYIFMCTLTTGRTFNPTFMIFGTNESFVNLSAKFVDSKSGLRKISFGRDIPKDWVLINKKGILN